MPKEEPEKRITKEEQIEFWNGRIEDAKRHLKRKQFELSYIKTKTHEDIVKEYEKCLRKVELDIKMFKKELNDIKEP